ncbi:unnamed protein product [Ectocarpus sp. 12 AP-2014]
MRVLLPDGEEKGNNPSFAPVATATPGNDDDAAGLGPSPQQHLPVSPRADLPPQPHPRAPSRETAADVLRPRTNGKQRPTTVAEPSKDNIALEGNVDDGRDVSTANAAQGFRPAARTSARDAAAGFSPSGAGGGGGTSGSRIEPRGGLSHEAAAVATENDIEEAFETELKAKGWQLRRQEGDGNCLFRAISQQIYGDPGMHGDIRRQCLDFMRKERDHYSQFVSEAFDSYVSRKEKDGVHGNNPEMQAASELFNRPIEVYVPEKGTAPINIFHGGYRSGNAPIRVSYHGGNHYNAIVDPEEASVGQGLGIPGLSKEAAEKESLKRALAESCSSAHHVFPGESPTFFKGGRGTRGSFGEGIGESDLRATEEELEQAAITASLADFRGTTGGGGSSNNGKSDGAAFSVPRRGGRGSGGRFIGRGAASRVSGSREERRGGGAAAWASGAGSSAGRVERGGWTSSGGGAAEGEGSGKSRKRRRPGSPPGEGSRKASPNSADGSTSSAVREMVWSYGFPLARVVAAHDLVGESVEDMLVLLTSDAFQPPENGDRR